jgi:hypothetical protein
MTQGGGEQSGDFCWSDLAARLIHPVQVEIIEALLWIDLSLTAADLVHILDGKHAARPIEYHLRRLTKLEVVELCDGRQRGVPAAERRYRLVRRPRRETSGP